MAPKRPRDADSSLSGALAKKQRTDAARAIRVQSATPLASEAAGPSKSVQFALNSMEGLPSSIDVEKFVEVRCELCNLTNLLIQLIYEVKSLRGERHARGHDKSFVRNYIILPFL